MRQSQQAHSSLEELRQIQLLTRRTQSLGDLREYFERVQSLRRTHLDDFDLQVLIADVHEEIVERARSLRQEAVERPYGAQSGSRASSQTPAESRPVSPGVERLDPKTWRRATFIGLFLTAIVLAGFFYLIQAARKSNLLLPQVSTMTSPAAKPNVTPAANALPVSLPKPMLRLYTDLVPGTVSVDGGQAEELKDGELVLGDLQPGRHSIQVSGPNGNAEFAYDVSETAAPEVVGSPSASNAMAVLVSTQDGKAHLVTNAENSDVLLDGNAAGQVGHDGLTIDQLTKADHDLQVTQGRDQQRFILTYTPGPALTVYVKSDPNAGTVVLVTHQDNTQVFINNVPYRRRTWQGSLRIPLKVGEYVIRVHKPGFIDPPPETVQVKKSEETAVHFSMQPVPQIATLAIRGALPATMVYIDSDLAAVVGSDGSAIMSNVKPGERTIELRREQALPKRFQRTFRTGDVVMLSGPDVMLAKAIAGNAPAPPPPAAAPASATAGPVPNYSMEIDGEQIRRGGGFLPYHVPRIAGHYSFMAQAPKGGLFKHAKVQWYAGYRDDENYVLFTLDGKHATVREVRAGASFDVARIPFDMSANEWVQVEMQVKPGAIDARVKTPDSAWTDIGGPAGESGQDFTQGKVGFYVPGTDELAISNFRFSNR